ncbi:MAG: Tex family protein [Bacilli bacterium]|nr:Tex family protein [Bacilli bacterium]
MNKDIIEKISIDLNIRVQQTEAVLKLLEEGSTIPFIARYRKEVTGSLDEVAIRKIEEVYKYQVNLLERKDDVIRLISEKGLMTPDLEKQIMMATKLVEIEDLYRPFKEKKKTKATDAIAKGLEPLAKLILSLPKIGNLDLLTKPYINNEVKNKEEAIEGAKYIIAEMVSDNALYRKWIRNFTINTGSIVSTIKAKSVDDNKVYEMYYDYKENVKQIKAHRTLAINRGEKEKILSIKINVDEDKVYNYLYYKILTRESFAGDIIKEAINDSYKRLIAPSIEREIRSELTSEAEEVAIDNFGKNLEKLLLTPPMKDKKVLALDPAYRTGCKLAVLDNTGKPLTIKVIYPHEPRNDYENAKKTVLELIDKYQVDIIAIGNGTASRESETFIADTIKEASKTVEYIIVSEAGASVYSASPLAIDEFPELHVEERSAISIGRRLQDPLAELVKIDPQSIGVGLYQHDVSNKRLTETLDFVVSKAVNQVGVNINTASAFLLKYVSGLSKKTIDKIINYRNEKGKILSRKEIKTKKIFSDKVFEQAIGFLRITDGINKLDMTDIHPESYSIAEKILKDFGKSSDDIGTEDLIVKLASLDINEYARLNNIDLYTLEDIIKSFIKPLRDPRDEMAKPLLRNDILHLEDLKVGMKLQGTVRNVAPFGAFIDIGLKNDGLVHISRLSDKYVKYPTDVVNVGDIVDCYVYEINQEKNKVSLSLLEVN